MRILFLTDNFPPETNAPATRTHEHTRVWAELGHDVTVITGAPNFPTGRVHHGYRNRPYSVEIVDGIRVVRTWTYIHPNIGMFRRTLDYLSFMMSAVPAALVQKRPDVIVGTSPQFFTVLAASAAGRLRRVPWVFELRDLWPESIKAVGAVEHGRVIRFLERLERSLYGSAAAVVSVTESFRRVLIERGVPAEKIAVVRNAIDLDMFEPGESDNAFRRMLGLTPDDFVATYVGTLGMAHGLTTVLDAAEETRDDPIHFVIVGEGAERERLEASIRERGLDNVYLVPGQPRERIPEILAAGNANMVLLRKNPLFETVIPSKIFEAMAMSQPIVLGVGGEAAEIVEGERCGIAVEPENAAELAAALRRLRDDPELARELGENGRRAAETRFDRRKAALRMLSVLELVAARAPSLVDSGREN